jgi:muramoyltetrapeptide carboxypeptidase
MTSNPPGQSLILFSPAGVVLKAAPLKLAAKRLKALGFDVQIDPAALAKHQRFAGTDEQRLEAIHRVAEAAPSIAMASRGGYGLTRLIDRIDWALIKRSVQRGTRWVGYSDMTAFHLAMLRHGCGPSWAGPMAVADFGRPDEEGGLDDVTVPCFMEAMSGELEAVGFRTEAGFDGLQMQGRLWGGNLEMVCALIGTPHFPTRQQLQGGILFLEDVNVHPYRVERCLLQLLQAGVLARQSAVLLGSFSDWKKSPLDRGYGLAAAWGELRNRCGVPLLTGLPLGHVATHVALPYGRRSHVQVRGRQVLLSW